MGFAEYYRRRSRDRLARVDRPASVRTKGFFGPGRADARATLGTKGLAMAARRFAPRLVVERWGRDDLFLRLFHDRLGFRLPGALNPVLPAGLPYPLGNVVP